MADTIGPLRRWDTEDRFAGVADASVFAAAVEEPTVLASAPARSPKNPRSTCYPTCGADVQGLQLLDCHTGDDSLLDVAASYSPGDSSRDIRRRAWALIGTIAEPAASVHEHLRVRVAGGVRRALGSRSG